MSVVKEDYRELAPHGRRLSDVVVLSQAWKKSHAFNPSPMFVHQCEVVL